MSPSIDQTLQHDPPISLITKPKLYRLTNGGGNSPKSSPPSMWFEIRLFYVRVSPCTVDTVPENLTLTLLRDEFNGFRSPASFNLRRDRVDREISEVTYVSTDNVMITGGVEFEVCEKENLVLCGSVERLGSDWSMDCYKAVVGCRGSLSESTFFQPKLGISSPMIEVYIAGRCSDVPVILSKTIIFSPRKKAMRQSTLDVIPEVADEIEKGTNGGNGLIRHCKLQLNEAEDEYEMEDKSGGGWSYPEEVYEGEDGQLSWFNAGVRVGVGIGLGMCLGVGIGVGLLMRSYQTTTRNLKRRFL